MCEYRKQFKQSKWRKKKKRNNEPNLTVYRHFHRHHTYIRLELLNSFYGNLPFIPYVWFVNAVQRATTTTITMMTATATTTTHYMLFDQCHLVESFIHIVQLIGIFVLSHGIAFRINKQNLHWICNRKACTAHTHTHYSQKKDSGEKRNYHCVQVTNANVKKLIKKKTN